MKTHELITLLARQLEPVAPHASTRILGGRLMVSGIVSTALMLCVYGLNPELARDLLSTTGLLKVLWPGALALAAFVMVHRLARPGVKPGHEWPAFVTGTALVWWQGMASWLAESGPSKQQLLWGQTWQSCSLSIAALALPMLAGLLWALRQLAPTRPALSGACAGLLAGTISTSLYALHCPEMAAPFLAVWYSLGIALSAVAGAAAGAALLRW